jgi:hypothetical protein
VAASHAVRQSSGTAAVRERDSMGAAKAESILSLVERLKSEHCKQAETKVQRGAM